MNPRLVTFEEAKKISLAGTIVKSASLGLMPGRVYGDANAISRDQGTLERSEIVHSEYLSM